VTTVPYWVGDATHYPSRLRILFLKCSLFVPELYAGIELATHYLCRSLIERRHHVAVAGRSDRPEFDSDQRAKCDHDCGYPVYRARRFEDAVARSIAEFRPDAVVCQDPGRWIGIDKFESFRGMAIVLYKHSSRDWFKLVPAPIRDRAAYVSNSASTAAHLKRYGTDSMIVPPLFGIDRFAGLESHGANVLFINMQRSKGADIAIEIARERPNISFVFIDSWTSKLDETARLQHLAASLPNVKLLQNQPDLRNVFQTTRLLLMPSRSREGWGRTATEAQLCGIPVLGSSRGQLETTIGPGGIALDPDAGISLWLRAFDSIWNDEAYYRVLSCRAKAHAAQLMEQKHAALERFESCLVSAVKRERLAAMRLLPRQPLVTFDRSVIRKLLRLSLATSRLFVRSHIARVPIHKLLSIR